MTFADKTFTVTNEHLKLLQRLVIRYQEVEFGAPEVDPKRPYGNSDVYGDIAEILELKPDGEVDSWGSQYYSTEQIEHLHKIHKEMEIVLQILVKNMGIEEGIYTSSWLGQDWSRVVQ